MIAPCKFCAQHEIVARALTHNSLFFAVGSKEPTFGQKKNVFKVKCIFIYYYYKC